MEFITILIVFAVISRIIEALGGGKKGKPGQPPPRTGRRLPQERGRLPGGAPPGQPGGAAADMLPDELWELLTGQKRPTPVPPPEPEEPVTAVLVDEEERKPAPDEEAELDRYIQTQRRDVQGEITATLDARRDAALDRLKQIRVPDERVPPSDAVRHREFHEKIDIVKAPPRPRQSAAARLGLADPATLRRAFVLGELLGPPRALEDDALDR